jgi:hypothetical protein
MRRSISFIVLLILVSFSAKAQNTETFETETNGATSFTDNGQTFDITGSTFDINSFTNGGWNGSGTDNKFIDNTGETAGNNGTAITIKTNDGTDITVSSIYIFAANTSLGAHTGSITITGKKDNATVYSFTKSSGFSNVSTFSPNNGFTLIDFSSDGASDYSGELVDEIIFTSTGNLEYMALDAFTWDVAPTTPTSAVIAATVFIEGAYNGTNLKTTLNTNIPLTQPYSFNGHTGGTAASIPANAVDWVLVELREAGSAAAALNNTKVGSVAGFLMNDGSIKATDGTSDLTISLSGNTGADFYVVIYHRNHLPIMSANAVSESGGTYTIDFTSNSANTYQNTTALVSLASSKFGMPAGDIDQDGDIDATDLSTWRTNNGAVFSYSGSGLADFNLDGVINAVDRNDFHQKNTSKTRQVPGN